MKKKIKLMKYVILIALIMLWLFPVLWAILMSFKTDVESFKWPLSIFPEKFTLDNYRYIINDPQSNLLVWIKNSVINSVIFTFLSVMICSLAAYPLARFTFKFKNTVFYLLLSTMMIPSVINLVPLYATVNILGINTNRLALIFPGVSSVFGLFLLRQFFMTLPREMEEAAMIDGAGHFKFFWAILLPLVKPSLFVLALTSFLQNWNDYIWPQIVVSTKSQQTLTLGLSIIKGQYGNHLPRLMAITVVSLILPVLFYLIFSKYLIKGIDISAGIK